MILDKSGAILSIHMPDHQEGVPDFEKLLALRNKVRSGENPEFFGTSLLPRQAQSEKDKPSQDVNFTELDTSEVLASIEEKGYYMLKAGTKVRAGLGFFMSRDDTSVAYLDVGEIEIPEGDLEVGFSGDNYKESNESGFANFNPESDELRRLYNVWGEISSKMKKLDADNPARKPQNYIREVRETIDRLKLKVEGMSNIQAIKKERERLAREFISKSPKLLQYLQHENIPLENAAKIALVAKLTV